ncbi:MAG TPA: class I SAM-dependent methyltransferase, partial [Bacteroidota bacterium]|nr:class I SAM-dependent methyltransferase [Bacteroidota bacterium]
MIKSTFSYVTSQSTRILFGIYLAELAKALRGCSSCLDVGCGGGSPLRLIGIDSSVGLDGHGPSVEEARRNATHDEIRHADVRTIGSLFPARSFDACIALDLIEHLTKEDGFRLLEDMERIASRRVIIFTPNGFVPQQSREGDLQEHLSGWEAGEMRRLGYDVIGLHGPKFLRGEYHQSRFLPRSVGGVVSVAAHLLYTRAR